MSEAKRIKRVRENGYNDGYANRPAKSREHVYQVAWRRGQEARRQDRAGAA